DTSRNSASIPWPRSRNRWHGTGVIQTNSEKCAGHFTSARAGCDTAPMIDLHGFRRRALVALGFLGVLGGAARNVQAQHEGHHEMMAMRGDTLASAPVSPTRL